MKTARIISVFLCIVMLLSALTIFSGAQEITYDNSYMLGDVNGDNAVNAKDVLCMKAHIVDVNGYKFNLFPADVDADGYCTTIDVYYVKSSIVGKTDLSAMDNTRGTAVFKIGGVDISEYCIVVPGGAGSSTNVVYAAKKLRDYTETATGVKPDLCYGEANATKSHKIIFNDVNENSELGQTLGVEGYKMTYANGNLNIYGTLRGNMYCAYEILERYLGFEFYSDTATFLWKQRCSDIPDTLDETMVPDCAFRMICQSFHTMGFEDHYLPRRVNGTQCYSHESEYKYGTLTGPHFINAHSYGYYWQMSTGYQKLQQAGWTNAQLQDDLHVVYEQGESKDAFMSDWGVNKPWQPCASDKEQYNNLFEGLVETMAMIQTWGHRYTAENWIMSFSPNDNIGGLCPCRVCSAKANGNSIRSTSAVLEQLSDYSGGYEVVSGKINFVKENYSGVYLDLLNRAAYDITHETKRYYDGTHTNPDTGETYTVDLTGIQTTYPKISLMAITYDLFIPATIKPEANTITILCGQGCNHHYLGTDGCGDKTTVVQNSNYSRTYTNNGVEGFNNVARQWSALCHENGARIWYWYYPVTYRCPLAPTPNVYNIYYDLHWLIDECDFDGIYYEGGGQDYTFEPLKAHIASKVMYYGAAMTEDDLHDVMEEYLYIYYGKGYEKVWEYLDEMNAAGDAADNCYINNYSMPWTMYDKSYVAAHYEDMRATLLDALDKAETSEQRKHVEWLIVSCDLMGLDANFESWYTNNANRALYQQRYDELVSLQNKYNINFNDYTDRIEAANYGVNVFTQVRYN